MKMASILENKYIESLQIFFKSHKSVVQHCKSLNYFFSITHRSVFAYSF